MPKPLLDLSAERLETLLDNVAFNWLVNDGVWFQAMEFNHGMNDAKRCNDSCWAQFSPFEAWSIRRFLGEDLASGLDGLKQALNFRVYGRINRQSFEDDGTQAFIFRMDECRVQAARKRKGEGIVQAQIDRSLTAAVRRGLPCLEHVRRELLGLC